MLRSLYIQNYALIEKLDIGFDSGFSVITGETGAGKSIILGAIGLLLGQRADVKSIRKGASKRADVKSIRKGASKCIIEARFDVSAYGMQPFFEANELEYEDECILRRELYASGKSRAFINDTPASLAQMKELGELLIDVHYACFVGTDEGTGRAAHRRPLPASEPLAQQGGLPAERARPAGAR